MLNEWMLEWHWRTGSSDRQLRWRHNTNHVTFPLHPSSSAYKLQCSLNNVRMRCVFSDVWTCNFSQRLKYIWFAFYVYVFKVSRQVRYLGRVLIFQNIRNLKLRIPGNMIFFLNIKVIIFDYLNLVVNISFTS